MSDEQGHPRNQDQRKPQTAFDLDELQFEPTGDPLVDRGMSLTLEELDEAQADPSHPDHEAAKAAMSQLRKSIGSVADTVYGDQFRRISENLTAALKPELGSFFSAPSARSLRRPPVSRPQVPTVPDLEDWAVDETPVKTLEALLEVSERMSEMVRVSAEHRDVAVQQMVHFKVEAEASRKSERRMLWLTWLALIGTWVAVAVTVLAP